VPPPAFESELNRSNLQKWAEQHPSIAKAKAETVQSQSRLDQKKSETWPQLYARISKPISSTVPGYTPEPTAFVGIRYSTSSGFSNHLQAQALATRVASAEEQVTAAINDLLHSLKTDQDEYFNAKYRIQSLEQAVRGSDLVLASYQRQFQAGKKSWQDLLNAVRESAQNEYALADARASMLGALYRVQIRAGLEVQ
jgi:adhesin transport system outer membrane protein